LLKDIFQKDMIHVTITDDFWPKISENS